MKFWSRKNEERVPMEETKRYTLYVLGKLPSGKIKEFIMYEDTGCLYTEKIFDDNFLNGYYDRWLTAVEIYQKNKKTGFLARKLIKYKELKFSRCVERVEK